MDSYQEVNDPNALTSVKVYWLNIHTKLGFDFVLKRVRVLSNFVTLLHGLFQAQNTFLSH
jgi:hypothetical protein